MRKTADVTCLLLYIYVHIAYTHEKMYTCVSSTYIHMLKEKVTACCALSVLAACISTTTDTVSSRGACLISKVSQERI